MKKLQDNLAARIAASVILTVSFLLTLLSTAGIVLLASYQAYNDGGAQLRPSYLHAAGVQEYYDHVEPVLEGLVHEPQSYQNYLNSLNVHVDVKTTDGTTVFSNAKEGETSLLEGPFSYTFTTGETKLWKNTFSDAEKAQRALERFPYQIEDYEIEASPFEYSTSYSPIDESLGDALDETLSGLESYYPMLKIWYYPEGSLTEVEVGVTLAAAPIGNDSVAVTARWIDLLIARRVWLILILVLSAACCVASFAFRLRTAGHKRGTAGITLRWLDRMPFEAYLLALAAVVLIIVFLASAKGELWSIAPAAVLLCFLLQTLPMTIAARCKAHTMWRNTLLRRLLDCIPGVLRRLAAVIRRVMPKLPLVWTALVCWLALSLLELGFLMAGAYAVLWIVEKVVFTPLVVLFLLDLRRLLDGSKRLAEGDLDHSVATDHMFSPLRRQANYLHGIRDGMRNAVEERMQSERMKTELITNVSHDIKTPLTSIVNYAGLLQRDGLSSPDAPEYLEVLVRQSTRLKKLTEDLVEASKASTGNLEVNLAPCQPGVLLTQAAGEYEQKLKDAGLDLVTRQPETAVTILADGRRLWRVFDNLMNNILYRNRYDELSAHVAAGLNAQSVFSDYPPEDLVNCDTFAVIDQILIKWLVERLVAEDTGAKLGELTIPQLCEKRSKMHFGAKAESRYQVLSSAYQMIQAGNYNCPDSFKDILRQYQETDSGLDYEYRRFYSAYDRIEDTTAFEPLRDLVENIYTNEYLETLLPKWATVEEMAEWTYFLAVVNQSMTAQDILIDNGEIAKANFVW